MSNDTHAEGADPDTTLRVALYTLSDSRTPSTDESGQYLREAVAAAGHIVADYRVVREDPGAMRQALANCVARGDVDAIICNGGTGIGPRDGSFEALQGLLDKELVGFGELFRALSFAQVGTKGMLSRATAGLMQHTVVVSLPGSTPAVTLAWTKILVHELTHMVRVAQEPVTPAAATAPPPPRRDASEFSTTEGRGPSGEVLTLEPPRRAGKIKHLDEIPFEDIYGARIIRTLERDELAQVGADYVIIGPHCSLDPHRHEVAESFLFIVKGSARVSLDGEFHSVKSGDFIYVPEKVFHGFETLDEPCEFYSIQSPPIYPVGEPADIVFANIDEPK